MESGARPVFRGSERQFTYVAEFLQAFPSDETPRWAEMWEGANPPYSAEITSQLGPLLRHKTPRWAEMWGVAHDPYSVEVNSSQLVFVLLVRHFLSPKLILKHWCVPVGSVRGRAGQRLTLLPLELFIVLWYMV